MCPTEVMMGFIPRMYALPGAIKIADDSKQTPLTGLIDEMTRISLEASKAMEAYCSKMRKDENQKRKPLTAKVGQYVWVQAKVFAKEGQHGLNKLCDRYFGPYKILEVLSATTYRVEVPQPVRGKRAGIIHANLLRMARSPEELEGHPHFDPPFKGEDELDLEAVDKSGVRSPSRPRSPRHKPARTYGPPPPPKRPRVDRKDSSSRQESEDESSSEGSPPPKRKQRAKPSSNRAVGRGRPTVRAGRDRILGNNEIYSRIYARQGHTE
jgi:hypothetical protein